MKIDELSARMEEIYDEFDDGIHVEMPRSL